MDTAELYTVLALCAMNVFFMCFLQMSKIMLSSCYCYRMLLRVNNKDSSFLFIYHLQILSNMQINTKHTKQFSLHQHINTETKHLLVTNNSTANFIATL